jgi:molybdate/tungstate transport system substrate-binding protein
MTSRCMLLVCGFLGGSLPVGGIQAQQSLVLHVALAGTMEQVISRHIGPAFTAATGYNLDVTRAPSVALANRIAAGELKPDVYISSDANVMELVMGPANNDRSRWYLPILRSRTVILYSPQSRFNSDFESVREGKLPWYEVMQRPGLVLKRPNPDVDSGGYRALFVFDLAERFYNLPGLKQRVLGDDHNETQYFDRTKEFPLIRDGHIDAFLTYITNALVEGFPFLDLPEEIDQSNPPMQKWYETASYTNPRGQTFRGAYGSRIAPRRDCRRILGCTSGRRCRRPCPRSSRPRSARRPAKGSGFQSSSVLPQPWLCRQLRLLVRRAQSKDGVRPGTASMPLRRISGWTGRIEGTSSQSRNRCRRRSSSSKSSNAVRACRIV